MLPLQQTELRDLSLLQTKWKSEIDPFLANPLNHITILKNIFLASGNNQVPHLLQRMQQGWFIVDINGAATVFRYQPFSSTYLYLTSSANVTVNLGVF